VVEDSADLRIWHSRESVVLDTEGGAELQLAVPSDARTLFRRARLDAW